MNQVNCVIILEQDLRNLCIEGKNIYEIAKLYNCSKNSIRNYMKKYNIDTPYKFYTKRDSKLGRPKGIPMSEEQKELRKIICKGENNPFYGKKHTEKTKEQMRRNHADFTGDKNPFLKAAKKNPQLLEDLSTRVADRWTKFSTKERRDNIKNRKNIYEDIPKNFWGNVITNAKLRDLEFNITPEYAWNLLKSQNFKCFLTGLDINISSKYEITASIDRINSCKGYIEGNIQWTHKQVNICKQTLNNEEFIGMAILIAMNSLENK